MYICTIDIGNTNIELGIFKKNKLLCTHKTKTGKNRIKKYKNEILKFIQKNNIDKKMFSAVVISSVAPHLNRSFKILSKECFKKKAIFVNCRNTRIKNLYKKPNQLGSDRIISSIAGYKLFGGPLIIINFGTATTFDCVNKKGEYLGGIIIPGIEISLKALHKFTAKLPYITPISVWKEQKNIIGQSTKECIHAGMYYGYTGMINTLIDNLIHKTGKDTKIVATGGAVPTNIRSFKKRIGRIIPHLTLYGLNFFYTMK